MPKEFTEAEPFEHNECFEEASRLVNGEFHLEGELIPGPPEPHTVEKLQRAATLLQRVLEINPENGVAIYFLGRIRLRCGDNQGSLRYLLKAQEIMPLSPGTARDSIMVAMELGQLDQALEIAKSALVRIPDDPGLLVNLGLVFLCSGRPLEAEPAFRKASVLEPGNPLTPKLMLLSSLVASGHRPSPQTESEVAAATRTLPAMPTGKEF